MGVRKNQWFTIGVKLLLGVALASNFFMGILLYVNWKANETVKTTVAEVLQIKDTLSDNMRETIVNLQNEFLALPDFFESSPRAEVLKAVHAQFTVQEKDVFEGREAYKSLYKRGERRDLAKLLFVVQNKDEQLFLSYGLQDEKEEFTGSVERLHLATTNPAEDREKVQGIIDSLFQQADSTEALQNKILRLYGIVADKGIAAEKVRNEILYHVEKITAMEQNLSSSWQKQQQVALGIGLLAIVGNVMVLYLLTRFIVERPLHRLTSIVEEISQGSFPEVPDQQRGDQIGVLSGAIAKFRTALMDLREEEIRKQEEQAILDSLVTNISEVILELDDKAKHLVEMALAMQKLATETGNRSVNVSSLATETAVRTDTVANSTHQLDDAVELVHQQVEEQSTVLRSLLIRLNAFQEGAGQLNRAVGDINTSIEDVQNITDQTRLLALNATIEAARAGKFGHGFAVVANEVKELSSATDQTAENIMEYIDSIDQVNQAFLYNFTALEQGAEQLKTVIMNINESVQAQRRATATIAQLTDQTLENTRSVSADVEAVTGAATETQDLSQKVYTYAGHIAEQLEHLLQETTDKLHLLGQSGQVLHSPRSPLLMD